MKFKKILILLIISFSLNAYSSYSGVYYCSDNDVNGFSPIKDFKRTGFKGSKFKAKIDYENQEVYSSEFFLDTRGGLVECKVNKYSSILCISNFGRSFSFNPVSRYFVRSSHFSDDKKPEDSIAVAYGTCEKF